MCIKTRSELIDELLNLSILGQRQRLIEFYESHDAAKVMLALEVMYAN